MKDFIRYIWEEHDVHDSDLRQINFDFEKSEVRILLGLYDDEAAEDVDFLIIFEGVFKFSSDFPPGKDFNPKECTDWNWQETEAGKYEAEFIFLSGMIGWTVTLGFTSLRTEGGLSEEARAARAAYFDEQTQD